MPDLLDAGHDVLGLARSDANARQLEEAGAKVHRGTLDDPGSLARGAEQADAVIHVAFDHDFANFAADCEKDRRVILAMGAVLEGSDRPFLVTSGVGLGAPADGSPATEDVFDADNPNPRRLTEATVEDLLQRGVGIAAVRLPQVHDTVRQGLVTPLIEVARAKGVSAHVGDGSNRMPGAHVRDVARLYRLALDGHRTGARWHAVAEDGIPVREIAQAVGEGLGVPVTSLTPAEAEDHFGWLGLFAGLDMWASGAWTRAQLGWHPTGPGLLEDLRAMDYGSTGPR